MSDNILSKFYTKLFKGNNNTRKRMALLIALFLFLIVVGICLSSINKQSSTTKQDNIEVSSKSYVESLEQRLQNSLANIKGISNVKIFINAKSSPKIEYATTKTQSGIGTSENIKTEIVFSKTGSNTYPVVITEIYPEITGVLIIAKGASDIKMQILLTNCLSSVLNINTTSIQILEGK